MSYLKFYQAQDMDVGLPLVSAPATGSPRGPSWYVMTNGTNTVQFHSPDSGNFTYSGSSLASGAMDAMWVWNGTVTDDAHLAYSVGTGVDPLTYIALAQTGNALAAQAYLLSGTATYSGNDYIDASGAVGNNTINAYDGSDVILGGAGDDKISGGPGNDTINGGAGTDTARYTDVRANYYLVNWGGETYVLPLYKNGSVASSDGVDKLSNIENVSFSDGTFSLPSTTNEYFRPLDYVASYGDLSNYFGTTANPANIFNHFAYSGRFEGRTTTFDGLEYIASHTDLMNHFGASASPDAGAIHYIQSGRFEGRTTSFDGLQYIASNPDLIAPFGANEDAGAMHYIQFGRFEGRSTGFDGLNYIASYGDLVTALGANADAGATHYIQSGHAEGRTISFDGLEYIASYGDLINALGANALAGTKHYISNGYTEGRHVSFDGLEYIASYGDLISAFHTTVTASAHPEDIGSKHFISNGYAEHRAPDHFDAAQYLANYADLQTAFHGDLHAATLHYITNGYFEGRTDHA